MQANWQILIFVFPKRARVRAPIKRNVEATKGRTARGTNDLSYAVNLIYGRAARPSVPPYNKRRDESTRTIFLWEDIRDIAPNPFLSLWRASLRRNVRGISDETRPIEDSGEASGKSRRRRGTVVTHAHVRPPSHTTRVLVGKSFDDGHLCRK